DYYCCSCAGNYILVF
nr:immunoglobulin light chain junction region [Macaca mulatta]MOW03294.1 immunoglobulin light chain junction region [Macaca mulatta]